MPRRFLDHTFACRCVLDNAQVTAFSKSGRVERTGGSIVCKDIQTVVFLLQGGGVVRRVSTFLVGVVGDGLNVLF